MPADLGQRELSSGGSVTNCREDVPLKQWSPPFLALGPSLGEDKFSTDWGGAQGLEQVSGRFNSSTPKLTSCCAAQSLTGPAQHRSTTCRLGTPAKGSNTISGSCLFLTCKNVNLESPDLSIFQKNLKCGCFKPLSFNVDN